MLSCTEYSGIKLGCAGLCWVALGCAGLRWVALRCARSCWVMLGRAESIGYCHFNLRLFNSISLFESEGGFDFQEINMLEQPKAGLIS